MRFLRSGLFNLYFFTASFVLTLIGTVIRFISPHRSIDIARFWARSVLAGLRVLCGIDLQVSGYERLDLGGPLLIASRHQSAFDTIVWLTLLPRCCYVLKQELLRIPLFGPLITCTGMIAVDRAGGASALRLLMREGERATRERRQIVIFPEGTRARPGALLPLQPGVAALANRTGLPIIPVVTDSGLCWGRRAFHKVPGTIHIWILEDIPAGTPRGLLLDRLEGALRSDMSIPERAVENSVG